MEHKAGQIIRKLEKHDQPYLVIPKGYYDSCKVIDKEMDIETFIRIDKRGNGSARAIKGRSIEKSNSDFVMQDRFPPMG